MERNKEESNKHSDETLPIRSPSPQQQRRRPAGRDEIWDHQPKRETNKVPEIYLGWCDPF